jgi:hypothetical protein
MSNTRRIQQKTESEKISGMLTEWIKKKCEVLEFLEYH